MFFKIILKVSVSQAFLEMLFCGWGGDIGGRQSQMVEEGSSVQLEQLGRGLVLRQCMVRLVISRAADCTQTGASFSGLGYHWNYCSSLCSY